MKTKSVQSMIQKALDGCLDDQEKKVWQAHLQQHPETEAQYQEQKEMSQLLQQVEAADTPPYLTQRILRAVRTEKSVRLSRWARFAFPRFSAARLKYVYSFSAGLALGMLLLVLVLKNTEWDASAVSGTIHMQNSNNSEILDLEQVKGQLQWAIEPKAINIVLSLDRVTPFSVQFLYPKGSYRLSSFYDELKSSVQDLSVGSNKTFFQVHAPGQAIFSFISNEAMAAEFTIEFFQADSVFYAKTIH